MAQGCPHSPRRKCSGTFPGTDFPDIYQLVHAPKMLSRHMRKIPSFLYRFARICILGVICHKTSILGICIFISMARGGSFGWTQTSSRILPSMIVSSWRKSQLIAQIRTFHLGQKQKTKSHGVLHRKDRKSGLLKKGWTNKNLPAFIKMVHPGPALQNFRKESSILNAPRTQPRTEQKHTPTSGSAHFCLTLNPEISEGEISTQYCTAYLFEAASRRCVARSQQIHSRPQTRAFFLIHTLFRANK